MGLRHVQEARAGDEAQLRVAGRKTHEAATDCVEQRRRSGQPMPGEHERRYLQRVARAIRDVEEGNRNDFGRVVGKGSGRDDCSVE